MQKVLLSLSAIMLFSLVACGTSPSPPSNVYVSPYGESVVARKYYTCQSSDGINAVATVIISAIPVTAPAAYIQITPGTAIEPQLTLQSSTGNCTSDNVSTTPVCTYIFNWPLASAPQQTLPFQLNGVAGESALTNMTVGGPICVSS